MGRQNIAKHVSAELREKIDNPIVFQPIEPGAKLSHGYDSD